MVIGIYNRSATLYFASPQAVFIKFMAAKGVIVSHLLVTLFEILGGLILGVSLGLLFAINMQLFYSVRLWLLPLLLFSQAVPVFLR